jgi:DNA-binding NarL/FixJ family response regulator
VIYTGSGTDDSIAVAFAHGVGAYIEKSASVEELLASLRAVVRGEFPLNSHLSGVLRLLVRHQQPRRELGAMDLLVLRKLAQHRSAKEIAHELGLSPSSVYKARTRISSRLGLSERTDFHSAAANLGLLKSTPEFAGVRLAPDEPVQPRSLPP